MLLDVSRAKIKADKIRRLKEHDSPELRALMKGSYDPNIEWDIPQGDVPYTPNEKESGHVKLSSKIPQLERLAVNKAISDKKDGTPQFKKEKMFIDIVESVHPDEAELLCAVKDKALHKRYVISKDVVKAAFDWTDEFYRKPAKTTGSRTWS